jgi:chemotaxis protein MotB
MAGGSKKAEGEFAAGDRMRWLVSYSDFVTLLLALFIVLFAIEAIKKTSLQELASSVRQALHMSPSGVMPLKRQQAVSTPYEEIAPSPDIEATGVPGKKESDVMDVISVSRQIVEELQQAMFPLIKEGLVEVRRHDLWIEIELKDKILFPSGAAELLPAARQPLEEVRKVIERFPYPVRVEGHTDNMPVRRKAPYPSNWELSAARAASVVRLFQEEGIDPRRMAVVGYGEQHPIADNATPQGRAQNRRVVIAIKAGPDPRERQENQQDLTPPGQQSGQIRPLPQALINRTPPASHP